MGNFIKVQVVNMMGVGPVVPTHIFLEVGNISTKIIKGKVEIALHLQEGWRHYLKIEIKDQEGRKAEKISSTCTIFVFKDVATEKKASDNLNQAIDDFLNILNNPKR